VIEAWADISALHRATGYKPRIGIEQGIKEFVRWHRTYYPTDWQLDAAALKRAWL